LARELALSFERLGQQRREELEAAPAILIRLQSSVALGLTEPPRVPRPSRRRPMDA